PVNVVPSFRETSTNDERTTRSPPVGARPPQARPPHTAPHRTGLPREGPPSSPPRSRASRSARARESTRRRSERPLWLRSECGWSSRTVAKPEDEAHGAVGIGEARDLVVHEARGKAGVDDVGVAQRASATLGAHHPD